MGTASPTYTIPEIIDIINEGRRDQEIPARASILIVHAHRDRRPDQANNINVPTGSIEDLPKCRSHGTGSGSRWR